MSDYIIPVIFFAAISSVAGVVLTVSGKLFRVASDGEDMVKKLAENLPGINCGACGFASCERYAEAINSGKAAPNQCKPGGREAVERLAAVLGKDIAVAEPEAAFVHCAGECGQKYDYRGTESCRAAELYYNGKEDCRFGCTGLGDCIRACPSDAITLGENNRAKVIHNKCTACGLCAKVCPKNLIHIQKVGKAVHMACHSHDVAKLTRAVCAKGCIGCKLCEKKCPKQAIQVRDNLAVINYSLCDDCGQCAAVCPSKCIALSRGCDVTQHDKY